MTEIFGTIRTCKFIDASNLFAGSVKVWDIFKHGDPDCSWGDNNRTMVTPQTIIKVLEDHLRIFGTSWHSSDDIQLVVNKCKAIIEFSKPLNEPVYIDLEN